MRPWKPEGMPGNDGPRLQVRHRFRELFLLGLRLRKVLLQRQLRHRTDRDRLPRQLRTIRAAKILHQCRRFSICSRISRLFENVGRERHSLQRIFLVEGALCHGILSSRVRAEYLRSHCSGLLRTLLQTSQSLRASLDCQEREEMVER